MYYIIINVTTLQMYLLSQPRSAHLAWNTLSAPPSAHAPAAHSTMSCPLNAPTSAILGVGVHLALSCMMVSAKWLMSAHVCTDRQNMSLEQWCKWTAIVGENI